MSKKIKIIVMILLVVIVAITISIIIHNNNDNKDNNDNNEYIQLKDLDEIVSVTEYERETYYLLKTNSNFVEYKVSMRSSSIEGNSDMKKLMSYSEYSNFCKENHFNQYYGDKNKNYIVYACEAKHSYINGITLQGITLENGEATLYVYENTEGDETKHPCYMIAIPTNKEITNVGVKEVLDLVQYYNATGREELAEEEKRKEKRKIINTIDAKPIIYLYPKEKMQLQVNLGYPNNVTCSYPEYSTEGWNVIVDTDGSMIDVNTGRNLYSLYWEGKNTVDYDTSYGFVVKGEDTIKFLEEKLEILGLTEREAEEFIIYWLPQMQNSKYNYIRFATEEEINENMPLSFSIEPDTLIRIIMVWEPLNKYIEIPEQELQTIERKGFVAVEWGGTKLCNDLTQKDLTD